MNDKMKNIKTILGELVTEDKGVVDANKLRDKLEKEHKEKKERNYKKKMNSNSFEFDFVETEKDFKKKEATRRKVEKNSKLEQLDMFSAVISDVSIKDDDATMSVPFFALSKVKDDMPRAYKDSNGESILKLEPSGRGLATIWDKDILLFCMSQIMDAINKKERISQTLKIETHSMFLSIKKGISQNAYENIEDALVRLRGTTIITSIKTGNKRINKGFGFIESFEIESIGKERTVKRKGKNGTEIDVPKRSVLSFSVKLSDWIFNALKAEEVLTLDDGYFQLSGGIERRLCELFRKHLGKQRSWEIKIENLFKKSGVKNSDLVPVTKNEKSRYRNALKKFRLEVRTIVGDTGINKTPVLERMGYKAIYIKEKDKIIVSHVEEEKES